MNLHIEKLFKCEKCVFKTVRKGDLKQHIKAIHDKIKDFKCNYDLCKYTCSSNSGLNTHINAVHNKIKSFKCNYEFCKFACSGNSILNQHIKSIHNKIKNVKCNYDLCEFTCSANGNLKQHVKQIHTQIKDFKCTYNLCNYTCSRNGHLKQHIKLVHTQIKDFKCNYDLCEYKCSENSTLKTHIKSVHERSPESKKMSHGEYKIYKILQKLDIEFTREFKFKDLISDKGSPLRYDFGIKLNDNNYLLIEFDGKQHFEKVRWTNIDSEQRIIERFEYLQRCDIQKNEYAKNNNHDLLRIKYDDKDIENKILSFFDENYELK